jgi:hypothetical protein
MNASPIGQLVEEGAKVAETVWSLNIALPVGSSESFKHLEDIILELNLVGLPNVEG